MKWFAFSWSIWLISAEAQNPAQATPEEDNPIATLERLLRQASDYPILIVIDNMEFLVAPGQTIRSRELKEAFNFLLSFPNVKLILAGKQLPFADMNPAASAVHHVALEPLTLEQSEHLIQELVHVPELKQQSYAHFVPFFNGEPHLLTLFSQLYQRHPETVHWIDALHQAAQHPEQVLINALYEHLSSAEKQILSILSLVRHGTTPTCLQAIAQTCDSALSAFDFKHLDKSLLRLALKKVYPPQHVLEKLNNASNKMKSVTPSSPIIN